MATFLRPMFAASREQHILNSPCHKSKYGRHPTWN